MEILDQFLTEMKKKDIVINYIQIYHKDRLEDEYCRLDTKTRLNAYSVSKSVTAIGVGIAIDEGLLRLEDTVDRFFPEYDYTKLSPCIPKITVENLLTMTCGLKEKLFFSDDADRYRIRDWVGYFMNSEFAYEPGTHFSYSNFNTYMLSCIVERAANVTLLDYMKPRFFEKIGIGNADWTVCPKGHNTAANGLLLTIDEMSKIGLFLLHEGVWDGEQLLSADFLRQAVQNHIVTDMPKDGYGYHFWLNPDRKSYRADGKYGQYIIVVPESELVITLQALDTKKFYGDVWEKLVVPYKDSFR